MSDYLFISYAEKDRAGGDIDETNCVGVDRTVDGEKVRYYWREMKTTNGTRYAWVPKVDLHCIHIERFKIADQPKPPYMIPEETMEVLVNG